MRSAITLKTLSHHEQDRRARHSFLSALLSYLGNRGANHLPNKDINSQYSQEIRGHPFPQTTMMHTHRSAADIRNSTSSLDDLDIGLVGKFMVDHMPFLFIK